MRRESGGGGSTAEVSMQAHNLVTIDLATSDVRL